MHRQLPTRVIVLAVTGSLAIPAAFADELMLEEIVVTAQKREQTLTDVPVAVSAISGELVSDYLGGAQDIRALAARVPGLNIETSNGRTQPRFYLRGMGNIDFDVNANQPVAMIFDDISLENNTLRSVPLVRYRARRGAEGAAGLTVRPQHQRRRHQDRFGQAECGS